MNEPRRFSVLIPAFNHAEYVEEAVLSAVEQLGDNDEVIIIDDGSNDGTLAVLQTLESDTRIQVHSQENQGAHATLNRLLDMAQGDLVFILNSDDTFEAGRLDRLAASLEAHPGAAVACSTIRIIDDHGHQVGIKNAWRDLEPWPEPHAPPHLADLNDPSLALLQSNWAATTSNLAFHRRLIEHHSLRFNALRYTHDWDFLLAASATGDIALVEQPLVRYRVHSGNTIREDRDQAQAVMRFEILWTVARHAASTLARAHKQGFDADDLKVRMMNSLPSFGRENILYQLLALRGSGDPTPASYDALLHPHHPFRRSAIQALERTS